MSLGKRGREDGNGSRLARPRETALRVEHVIETFSEKAVGCWNSVYEYQHPARRSFGRRLLEFGGYRNSTAVASLRR